MDLSLLQSLNTLRAARKPAIFATRISDGHQRLITDPLSDDNDPLAAATTPRWRSGKSGMITTETGEEWFLNAYIPAPELIIIGAVHIAQVLVPMARAINLGITIVDPRTAFATHERFEDVQLFAEWPQEIAELATLDPYTALIAVTHDPKIDDWPLQQALKSDCFYVGALGSRKTHAKRVDRFKESGISEDQIGRIAAPIGLDIGAQTPAEIAVAILAQIIAAFRKPEDRP